MKKPGLAACGIDCSECASYKATVEHDMNAAEQLAGWYRSRGWIGENEGARAVMAKNPLCKGCRNMTDDCFFKHECSNPDFRGCCDGRRISHCGECDDFPCAQYEKWASQNDFYKKAMKNLLAFRADHGN